MTLARAFKYYYIDKYFFFLTPLLIAFISHFAFGYRGITNETVHLEISLNESGLSKFLYPYDSSRRLMQIPYALALLIDDYSYVGFVIVFLIVVSLNILLFSLILKQLFNLKNKQIFLAQIIYGLYFADSSNNFIPMFVVKFSILFFLLSILVYLSKNFRLIHVPLLVIFQMISMFTYDVIIVLFLISGLLIFLTKNSNKFSKLFLYYSPIFMIILLLINRYLIEGGSSYQSKQLNFGNISNNLSNFWTILIHSYNFLSWPVGWISNLSLVKRIEVFKFSNIILTLSALVIIMLLWRARHHAKLLLITIFSVILSIVPYAFIGNSIDLELAGPWRSLLLASLPVSFFFFYLIHSNTRAANVCNLFIATYVISGLLAASLSQLYYKEKWEQYVTFSRDLHSTFSNPNMNSLIIMFDESSSQSINTSNTFSVNLPLLNSIFESNIWFNSTIQLLYPDKNLVGLYYSNDGQIASDIEIEVRPNEVEIIYSNVGVNKTKFQCDEIYFLKYVNGVSMITNDFEKPSYFTNFTCTEFAKHIENSASHVISIPTPLLGEIHS